MSAQRLRDAAKVLREAAEGATPGPWVAEAALAPAGYESHEHGADLFAPSARTLIAFDDEGGAMAVEDARYIATMHPPVALALADWLDRYADIQPGERLVRRPAYADLAQALVVADAILGTTA